MFPCVACSFIGPSEVLKSRAAVLRILTIVLRTQGARLVGRILQDDGVFEIFLSDSKCCDRFFRLIHRRPLSLLGFEHDGDPAVGIWGILGFWHPSCFGLDCRV